MTDEFPKQFERYKPAGHSSFFNYYKQKSKDSKLRNKLEELLGHVDLDTFERIKPEAENNLESAVNAYLEELSSPTSSVGATISSDTPDPEPKIGIEDKDIQPTASTTQVKDENNQSNQLVSNDSETNFWGDDDSRYLGSIQADIWCTRSGRNLVEFGESLRIERLAANNSKFKSFKATKTTPSLFQNKDDFLVRVYNSKGLDIARIREEDSRFMAVLMDANMARFNATVIFADSYLRIGSTVTVQLNCYLKKSAFSTLQSFPIDGLNSKKKTVIDESKESNEERFVRLRQQALVIMFKKLGTPGVPAEIAATDTLDPSSTTPPPLTDDNPNTGGDEEGEDEDEDELNQDQLDIFYKDGISNRKDLEPKIETTPPSSTFGVELFGYQKRGLTWMLDREKVMADTDARNLETHPLWTRLSWPEGDFFWVNFNSGELSASRPTLALKCRGGILADDMGLGKTISLLSLIHTAAAESTNGSQCTLIVAPTTLLSQWESEVQKVSASSNACGCLVYYRSYNGSSKNGQSALSQFVHHANFPIKVVLTTYGMVSSEHKSKQSGGLFSVKFDRIVLDEAHNIKNRNTQAAKSCFDLKASRRWALTGTPVVNRLEDLYSLIRYIGLEPWNNFAFWRAFVTIKFQNPDTREVAMKTVQAVVTPICLRRTKAMKDPNTGRPLVELPGKTVEIKRVQFSEQEKVIYSHLYTRVQKSVRSRMQDGTASAKYSAILALLLRLRQVCCHPLMLRRAAVASVAANPRSSSTPSIPSAKRVKYDDNQPPDEEPLFVPDEEELASTDEDLKLDLKGDIEELLSAFAETPSLKYTTETLKGLLDNPLENQECAICSENHSEPVLTECLHAACRDCMMTHIEYLKKRGDSPNCPICRSSISANRLFTVNYNQKRLVPLNNGLQSTKIRALVNALREASARGMGKSVVFSQFTSFLDLIQVNLKENGFSVFRFDGSMTPAQRLEAQEGFKSSKDGNAVLLLSQKAGGVGLNLVAANHAYLMDPWWNYASESQAIDRIYRLGQTDDVNITRFIIQGSIEERILKIQEHKRVLSNLVTEEERRADNLENIRMLFEIDDDSNNL